MTGEFIGNITPLRDANQHFVVSPKSQSSRRIFSALVMVHYIRFLKPPKFSLVRHSRPIIKALITITSDLGDRIYEGSQSLWITFISSNLDKSSTCTGKDFLWKAGMRSLWIEIDHGQLSQVTWPAQMVVAAHSRPLIDMFSLDNIPEFVGVWSDSIDTDVSKGYSPWVMRRLEPIEGVSLNIREETGESIARHVWDGGIALAACLSSTMLQPLHDRSLQSLKAILHVAEPETLNVLELGSGCGLVGIAFASVRPKCRILLTDLPDAMDILDYNISHSQLAVGAVVEKLVLDWDDKLPTSVMQEQYGLILVSECTYNEITIPALVRTLSVLIAQSPAASVVVGTKVRHSSEAVFFNLMSEVGFVVVEQLAIPLPDLQMELNEQCLENVDVYVFCKRLDASSAC